MQPILQVNQLSKIYPGDSDKTPGLQVLQEISFSLDSGTSCAIVGPSGSGKTTLLGLCAGLDSPSSGEILIENFRLNQLTEDERAVVRSRLVGFVFQSFQLIPTLTAIENVMVPLELQGERGAGKIAKDLLERVGLGDRLKHYPSQLSGGEQQRVAIARAFSNSPKILFADEPTGNLDEETSEKIEKLLFDLNHEEGTTLVMVTHDMELAAKTDRIIRLKGGKLVEDFVETIS